ncbi:MAG: DUF2723 domain-containing protein [Anaerolineae bacterium]|nr:DUF2723 domain-containing protein [Anaerolineae bacterium]
MTSIHISERRATIVMTLAVVAVVTCLYASTLMTTISGCADEYCNDTGEFQIALPLWGTVHYTGYPLYMMLGSPFVSILRAAGISPAMGSSLYSLFWNVLAVAGLVVLVRRLSGELWLAGSVGLLFAVIEPIWVHGVIAEVYSLNMALSVAILYLTFDLHEHWSDKRGWLLAFLGGTGIAHHRLLALLLVPVGLYLLPTMLRSRSFLRWIGIAALCAVAGFLPYLDIPLRISLGSTWNYDQANAWQGFWRVFRGEEVAGLQRPNLAPAELLSAAKEIGKVLVADLTIPGITLLVLAGIRGIWMQRTRAMTWFVAGIGVSYVLFALFFHKSVLLQGTLMGALLAACVLLSIGFSSLKVPWQHVATLICLGWGIGLAVKNWPFVTFLTRDYSGETYTATVENLEAPDGSVVMAPWGGDYFSLAYAQRVEGRMPQWQIVDHRIDFGTLTANTAHRVYIHYSTLYVFGQDWWIKRLGSPLRIASRGPEMLMLTSEPLDAPTPPGIPIGDGIALDHWEVREPDRENLNVILYWVATETPSADYSTFVHVSDRDVIDEAEDLIAQSDYNPPVYGWYPTSQWVLNEVIREDHPMQTPPERSPRLINIGMYRQDADGVFQHLEHLSLKKQADTWVIVSPETP